MVENHGSILRPDVVALAVERRRGVNGEEDLQDVLERDDVRVERDLEALRMVRGARADLLIRRVFHVPARVTDDDLLDTAQLLEDRLVAPEATAAEGRDPERLPRAPAPPPPHPSGATAKCV